VTVAADAPQFSVITPVYETALPLLEAAIASVENQTCPSWELLLVDDGSRQPGVHRVLDAAAARDRRIRVIRRPANGGIVAASNDGLAEASAEFVALLDHDDELHPDALSEVAAAIDRVGTHDVDYVYSDEDKIDEDGRRFKPFYKPDWSPDRFRAQMYTNHLSVWRRALAVEVGGFRPEFEGSQDYDLVFRLVEKARTIVHVPKVLYHWRVTATSVTSDTEAKPYAWLAGAKAIQAHCDRTGFEARIDEKMIWPGMYHLAPALREHPLVSIIIPTAGSVRELFGTEVVLAVHCIRSVIERSTYDNYEIVLVADTHTPAETLRQIEEAGGDRLRTITYSAKFNFADKCNVGAVSARGEHLLLLNDDTEVIAPDWLESMLMYSRADGIGAVGARLLFGDRRIQHVGVAVLDHIRPGHIYRGYPENDPGYYGNMWIPCNYLAVTAACLMSPRSVYEEVGGLSKDFPINYNDVDYCFKVTEAGYRIVYDPNAELYHHESSTRAPELYADEVARLIDRWPDVDGDPYLNPNFDHDSTNYLAPAYSLAGESYARPYKRQKLDLPPPLFPLTDRD
jgi:GT2 family glycosyltransferase